MTRKRARYKLEMVINEEVRNKARHNNQKKKTRYKVEQLKMRKLESYKSN